MGVRIPQGEGTILGVVTCPAHSKALWATTAVCDVRVCSKKNQ